MILTCEWADLIIWMVYMKDQVANTKCGIDMIWYECEGELIICENKFWRMVRYPWGAAKLYSIRKDLVEQNKDL